MILGSSLLSNQCQNTPHCNSPLQYAEDGGSSEESDVATQVGNECHEGVSVELLSDLQYQYLYRDPGWPAAVTSTLVGSSMLSVVGMVVRL